MKYRINLLLSCSHIIAEDAGNNELIATFRANVIRLDDKRFCYICNKEGTISKIGSIYTDNKNKEAPRS